MFPVHLRAAPEQREHLLEGEKAFACGMHVCQQLRVFLEERLADAIDGRERARAQAKAP